MVVVITIIAIIAGSLVPVITRPYITEKRLETISEMGAIEEAIVGRPEYGDPGYLGTVGQVPTNVQALLIAPGSVSAVTVTPSVGGGTNPQGVPFGWNGPYLKSEFEDPTVDAWGTAYTINTACDNKGGWSITSAGPDKVMGTGDDFIFPTPISGAPTYCFQSRGNVIEEVDESYGAVQQPAPAADLQTATGAVQLWYPLAPTAGTGLPTVITCGDGRGNSGPMTGTVATYECPANGSGIVPFGIPIVQVNVGSAKFPSIPSGTWYQTVVHHRVNTYQKVSVPATPLAPVAALSVTPVATGSVTSTTPSGGLVIQSVNSSTSGVSATNQATLYNMTASGMVTLPNDGTTYCAVVPQWNNGGTWTPPITSATLSTFQAAAALGGWVQQAGSNSESVSFSVSGQYPVAAGNTPNLRVAAFSTSGSCQVISAQVSYSLIYTSP
jgi:hypothetical protein